ncbi:hypothetical protein [Actinokineospora enzanensis]|uniref:hypothetical protein n=1 Tax=Actinokineospora enzanensis TaxID=155975 RepID=UPI00036E4259|nr:hypothetical protein [Actinokineospora enzanensis]
MPTDNPRGVLSVDQEAVAALTREATDLRAALDEVLAFARAESLTPRQFGTIGAEAGAAFTASTERMLDSFERAIPEVETMVSGLSEATRRLVDTDEEAARHITRAGER